MNWAWGGSFSDATAKKTVRACSFFNLQKVNCINMKARLSLLSVRLMTWKSHLCVCVCVCSGVRRRGCGSTLTSKDLSPLSLQLSIWQCKGTDLSNQIWGCCCSGCFWALEMQVVARQLQQDTPTSGCQGIVFFKVKVRTGKKVSFWMYCSSVGSDWRPVFHIV